MTMARTLAQFSITRRGDDYLLTLEDQAGDTVEMIADYDQLDLITEAIEERLDADEEAAMEPDEDDDDQPNDED